MNLDFYIVNLLVANIPNVAKINYVVNYSNIYVEEVLFVPSLQSKDDSIFQTSQQFGPIFYLEFLLLSESL